MSKKTHKSSYILIWLLLAFLFIVFLYFLIAANKPNQERLDAFAACLSDSGAKFYGAFWCSHCQNQKNLFGSSKNLPYIECSTPDGKGELSICKEANITGYPTWVFKSGQQVPGELSFQALSNYSGCAVPQSNAN